MGELCRYGIMIFLSAWMLQGLRIMDWHERIIKLGLDVIVTSIFVLLGAPILIAFVLSHTLNFIFNGQLYAMFTHMGATRVTPRRFFLQTCRMKEDVSEKNCVIAAIAYGSLSRGCYKTTSDIDLRLIPSQSELGRWLCALYCLRMRICAFIMRYPLDLYMYDPKEVVTRMRSDELPIILKEQDDCMRAFYPDRVEFEEFKDIFTEVNLRP